MNPDNVSEEKPKRHKRGTHPKSLANLQAPWTAENRPKSPGRPKLISDGLRDYLESNPAKVKELNAAIVETAVAGDAKAYQTIRETIEGKLPQELEHSGNQTVTHAFDGSRLSDDELAQLEHLIESAHTRGG